ncbi:MAG: putative Ig domain-containing protein [Desulfobacteraceae bacterium]
MDRVPAIRQGVVVVLCGIWLVLSFAGMGLAAVIIDHNHTDITQIPQSAIEQAKATLHIAYGHTSHGSQLTTGMSGLVAFANNGGLGLSLPNDIFAWNNGGSGGALDLHDYAMGGDVGYYPQWVNNTRSYLDDPANADVNVIIWSWCGQASGYTHQEMIDYYLAPMSQLEQDYPHVIFVYMTGHADGTGESGNLHQRNQQIRAYCQANNKVLFDFYDIEIHDPAGNYFGDKLVNDNCDYDSDGNGSRDANWAIDWQNAHTQGLDWYACASAHSQPLNANRKAYAAWWLWAVLGGWGSSVSNHAPVLAAIGDKAVDYNQLLTFVVSASDTDIGDVLTYGMNPILPGAVLDSASGVFQWTPTSSDDGDHQITFSVVDDGNPQATDTETITISVVDPNGGSGGSTVTNHAPVLASIGDRVVEYDQLLAFTISASDPDSADQLTYSMSPVIQGAVLDSSSGVFQWTPGSSDDGDHQITFSVADDGTPQAADGETITISVVAPNTTSGGASQGSVSGAGDAAGSGSSGCFIGTVLKR